MLKVGKSKKVRCEETACGQFKVTGLRLKVGGFERRGKIRA